MNRVARDDALPALPGAPRRIPTAAAASAALLRPVTESTTGLPAHEQFAAWSAMRAPIIETLPGRGRSKASPPPPPSGASAASSSSIRCARPAATGAPRRRSAAIPSTTG